MWHDDDELFRLARERLFSAVIGDILDECGFRRQFLPAAVRPLRPDMVVVGRAMPVLEADLGEEENPAPSERFGLMFQALDDLKPGEVYVVTGASPTYALWGELMSTRAIHLQAAGAVCNGYSRDTQGILRLDFPTFSYGAYAQDQGPRGRVVDFRCPVQFGQVRMTPGDLVFGDIDGVVVVPRAVEEDVLRRALDKASTENKIRTSIEAGMSSVEAFTRYGIM